MKRGQTPSDQHYLPRSSTILRNNRGAAFLLAVYLSALTLLLLGGVSLQRTNTELRAAQLYRDAQQSFWLAETSLDEALRHAQQETLHDGLPAYLVAPGNWLGNSFNPLVQGTASFTLLTAYGKILGTNEQLLLRQVQATGRSGSRTSTVSAYYSEDGPLYGLWAKGVIAIHGGRGRQPSEIVVTGNLNSNLGAFISTIPQHSVNFTLDGLTTAPDRATLETASCRSPGIDCLSSEMLSLKSGYMLQQGLLGENDTKVSYNATAQSKTSAHLQGALSVGLMDPPATDDANHCADALLLGDTGVTDVSDNFRRTGDRGHQIRDISRTRDFVTLCVNALVPSSPAGFVKLMNDDPTDPPPEVRFHQPTKIYLSGSRPFNFSRSTFQTLGGPMTFDTLTSLSGIVGWPAPQAQWNFSIGAKLSAVDAYGNVIPNGIQIIQTTPSPQHNLIITPPGVIAIKPGKFSGSIFAPNSTVAFRARWPEDQVDSQGHQIPLQLQSIVGKEVVVELESDQVKFDRTGGDPSASSTATVDFVGWTN